MTAECSKGLEVIVKFGGFVKNYTTQPDKEIYEALLSYCNQQEFLNIEGHGIVYARRLKEKLEEIYDTCKKT